jgi:hypothetical protein
LQYERERRWVNLYRQHDVLRGLSDDEYDRLINYVDSATNLVLDVMQREKAANKDSASPAGEAQPATTAHSSRSRAAVSTRKKKPAARKKASASRKTRSKAAKP